MSGFLSTYRKTTNTVQKATFVVVFVLLVLGVVALQAWLLMLALGMLAGYTGISGLAIGFWATAVLGGLLRTSLLFGNRNG